MDDEQNTIKRFYIVKDIFPSVLVVSKYFYYHILFIKILTSYIGLCLTLTTMSASNDMYSMSLPNSNGSELYSPQPSTESALIRRVIPSSTVITKFKQLRQSMGFKGSEFSDEDLVVVFRFGILLFTAILVRGLIRLCEMAGSNRSGISKFLNFLISVLIYILNVFYIVYILFCFLTFLNLSSDALFKYPYGVVMLTFYTVIGLVDLCEKILFFILIVLSIPYYISLITTDSKDFFLKFGISEVRVLFIINI
jgi:hypothetical protein